MTIQVFVAETGEEVPVDFSTFPGGEEHELEYLEDLK